MLAGASSRWRVHSTRLAAISDVPFSLSTAKALRQPTRGPIDPLIKYSKQPRVAARGMDLKFLEFCQFPKNLNAEKNSDQPLTMYSGTHLIL